MHGFNGPWQGATGRNLASVILMDGATVLGYIAGTCTTIAFLPQVVKAYSTRSCHDISGSMLAIFAMGILFWFFYGILIGEMPIIIANGVTFILVVVIAALKVVYGRMEGSSDQ
jgi:MtN3 and saliva related transmembrane protein